MLSNRESEIISLLLRNQTGMTLDDFINRLQVSRRTVYRELSGLNEVLAPFNITLDKHHKVYQISGESHDIQKLQSTLLRGDPVNQLDTQQRQASLAIRIMFNSPKSARKWAEVYNVSEATISQDLGVLTGQLNRYQLAIQRRHSLLKFTGSEKNLRLFVVNCLNQNINEYEFFHSFQTDSNEITNSTQFFLDLLTPSLLQISFGAIRGLDDDQFDHLSDQQKQQLILLLTVSAMRIEQSYLIEGSSVDIAKSFEQLQPIAIFEQFSSEIKQNVNLAEVDFLTQYLQALPIAKPNQLTIEDQNTLLTYQLQNLIKSVSLDDRFDFRQDEKLFSELLVHMSSTVNQPSGMMPKMNLTLQDKIQDTYPNLYRIVKKQLREIFTETTFTESEILYIVLYFATSFERSKNSQSRSALVICANGIGTANILATRLQKVFPEVKRVKTARVTDLSHLDFSQFDLILSTLDLPGFKYDYQLVSPLLTSYEIETIRQSFNLQPQVQPELESSPNVSFDQVYESMKQAHQLLDRVKVLTINNDLKPMDTIKQVIQAVPKSIISDETQVTQALVNRVKQAPVGIPQSGLALLHTLSPAVNHAYFSVYELQHPIMIQGMNQQSMPLRRILLLLGPSDMSPFDLQLVSSISSSVIDNDLNLKIYQKEDQHQIRNLIGKRFLEIISQFRKGH